MTAWNDRYKYQTCQTTSPYAVYLVLNTIYPVQVRHLPRRGTSKLAFRTPFTPSAYVIYPVLVRQNWRSERLRIRTLTPTNLSGTSKRGFGTTLELY